MEKYCWYMYVSVGCVMIMMVVYKSRGYWLEFALNFIRRNWIIKRTISVGIIVRPLRAPSLAPTPHRIHNSGFLFQWSMSFPFKFFPSLVYILATLVWRMLRASNTYIWRNWERYLLLFSLTSIESIVWGHQHQSHSTWCLHVDRI